MDFARRIRVSLRGRIMDGAGKGYRHPGVSAKLGHYPAPGACFTATAANSCSVFSALPYAVPLPAVRFSPPR